MSTRTGGVLAAVTIFAMGIPAEASSAWNASGTISGELRDLHVLALWICAAVVAVVYGAMIRAIIKASPSSRSATPGRRSHRTAAEVMWTIAAAAIMVAMAVPAVWGLVRHENAAVAPGRVAEADFLAASESVYHGRCDDALAAPQCMPIVVEVTRRDADRRETRVTRLD